MFGKFYVLSDAAPCCFSEATLGEFLATSGSPMECKVRGMHTIDGGSRPLPVWYVFHTSASDYSRWSIIDCLLYVM